MKRLFQGSYTPEFRAEAVKLVLDQRMAVGAVAKQLSLPKSRLNNWVVAAKAGQLAAIGKDRRQPSEAELELARLRKELAETKLERDLLLSRPQRT